jgi:tripartite ATP-independent transporter DctP family solute receptor
MIRNKALKLTALLASSVVASACGFLTGESGQASDGSCPSHSLRLATIRAESDPATLGAKKFGELISTATDGRIKVQVFPNSQLGDVNSIFAGLSSGQEVDMFYEGISIYPTLKGASAFTVVSVPFLWDSYEQLMGVLHSERFSGLLEKAAQDTGVRVIAIEGDAEPRALSADRPIPTPQEMKGLKLRIAEAPMPQAFARALGADPEVIPLSDLYLALRQGVADAQENGAIAMVNQSLDEVQDYYMPTNYIRDARSWYISDKLWDSVCEEDQKRITDAAVEAGKLDSAEVEKQLAAAETKLASTINVVQPDIRAFRAALAGQFEKFDGDLWPKGLLTEVEELKKQFR